MKSFLLNTWRLIVAVTLLITLVAAITDATFLQAVGYLARFFGMVYGTALIVWTIGKVGDKVGR